MMANFNTSNPKLRIVYSDRYSDDNYEYRYVIFPLEMIKPFLINVQFKIDMLFCHLKYPKC